MIPRTPTLAEWPYRMVRLACDQCPRRGQYRKETLVARFGGDVLITRRAAPHRAMPAQRCARRGERGTTRTYALDEGYRRLSSRVP